MPGERTQSGSRLGESPHSLSQLAADALEWTFFQVRDDVLCSICSLVKKGVRYPISNVALLFLAISHHAVAEENVLFVTTSEIG